MGRVGLGLGGGVGGGLLRSCMDSMRELQHLYLSLFEFRSTNPMSCGHQDFPLRTGFFTCSKYFVT